MNRHIVEFSPQQLDQWRAYEETLREGCWNMFSIEALEATGLDRISFFFVMENYAALREAVLAEDKPQLTYAEWMAYFGNMVEREDLT